MGAGLRTRESDLLIFPRTFRSSPPLLKYTSSEGTGFSTCISFVDQVYSPSDSFTLYLHFMLAAASRSLSARSIPGATRRHLGRSLSTTLVRREEAKNTLTKVCTTSLQDILSKTHTFRIHLRQNRNDRSSEPLLEYLEGQP